MVSTKFAVFLTVVGFLLGFAVSVMVAEPVDESNFVLPKEKWQCFVRVFESDQCVAYRLKDKELEDIDARYRKHNPKQGPSFHNTK